MIGRNPYMGMARDDKKKDLRSIVEQDYVILYRVAATGVKIVRVIHGRRNISALLEK